MTDTMLTHTALTEAAKAAVVTTDQARTILEAAGVKVETEKPTLPTEPGSVIIATEVRGVTGKWRMFLGPGGHWFSAGPIGACYHHSPNHITAWTEAVVVPAGEKIDPDDVRAGDRVRVERKSGDEAMFTVTRVDKTWIWSRRNIYLKRDITAAYLLHREEA